MVTISLTDPLVSLPDPSASSKILAEINEGRQKQFVVQGGGDEAAEFWKNCTGVASVRIQPATLEELFVACTRGDSKYAHRKSESGNVVRPSMEAQRS